jgi:hypothetical protein
MSGDYGPTWREIESERNPHELELECEAYGLLAELEAEHRRMLREIRAAEREEGELAGRWYSMRRLLMEGQMEFLVDAGRIQKVTDTSARAAAQLTLIDLGPRAQWPIDVYSPAGDVTRFVLAPPEPPAPAPNHPIRARNGWHEKHTPSADGPRKKPARSEATTEGRPKKTGWKHLFWRQSKRQRRKLA